MSIVKTVLDLRVRQGALENLDNVLFYTDPEDGLNYDLTFTDVDTLEYYLQLIEE